MGFFDDITGKTAAKAARDAANLQYQREQAATQGLRQSGSDYQSTLQQLSELFAPYGQAGKSALEQLIGGLGLGGAEGSQKFTEAYRALPGYQSGLETGTAAVNTGANARGMLNSGRTMKDLYRFGSNYEDQRSGDYLNRLGSLAGMGQTATGQQATTAGAGAAGKLNADTSAFGSSFKSAATEPLGMVAGANARQQGTSNLLNFGGNILGKLMGFM